MNFPRDKSGFTPHINFEELKEVKSICKLCGGFTVIEMVIVFAIIGVLSAMTLVYSRSSSEQLKLFKDEATIMGILNRAKSLAAEKFNRSPNACAFGVRFIAADSVFYLFNDLKPPEKEFCKELDGTRNSNLTYDPGETVQSFNLEKGLVFEMLSGEEEMPVTDNEPIDIIFIPPEFEIASNASFPVKLIISSLTDDTDKAITINENGQINAE